MTIRVGLAPLVWALGLLAGCGSGGSEQGAGKVGADTAEMKQKLESLSAEVRALEQRVHELSRQNSSLEKMLATAEQDLRSRLKEMVQQEWGGPARAFAQRPLRAPVLPRPYLGFDGETNSPEAAAKLGVAANAGAGLLVGEVTEEAPADVAGLQKGDLVRSLDGKPVKSRDDLVQVYGELKPGQECELSILRGEKQIKLTVKVGAR